MSITRIAGAFSLLTVAGVFTRLAVYTPSDAVALGYWVLAALSTVATLIMLEDDRDC